jgi:RNA polymerase sigma-70 factor, ECF subfamily
MGERRAIERLIWGDIGGLETLVREHQVRAVRTADLIVRDRALAEDVVQGAFVRAYERIGGFDVERPFGPWFMMIVVNEAVAVARRRERTVTLEEGLGADPAALLADPEKGPQELAEEAEERRRVWAALGKLPPTQRAAVVQRYYLGMSESEMTEGGTFPPGTIKWRLHAARKSLSKLLRARFDVEGASAIARRAKPAAVSLDEEEAGGRDRG